MSNDSQQTRFINLVNTIASLQREKNEAEEISADEKQHLQNNIFDVCLIPILSTYMINYKSIDYIFFYSLKNWSKN